MRKKQALTTRKGLKKQSYTLRHAVTRKRIKANIHAD